MSWFFSWFSDFFNWFFNTWRKEYYPQNKGYFQTSNRKGKCNYQKYYEIKYVKSASPEKGFKSPARKQIPSEGKTKISSEANVGDSSESW